jgi:16S rRNA (guanine527-N7)-methyltransferase
VRPRTRRGPRVPSTEAAKTALERLARGARSILHRELTEDEVDQFNKYLLLLIKWNSQHRMIGSNAPLSIVENLFLDSLLFLHVIPNAVRSLVDIGSGAGLPGLPMKIVRPEIRTLLVESKQRRASFLKTAVRELGLSDIEVLSDRVLTAPDGWRKTFDAAVARCAGNTDSTIRLAMEFVRAGGPVVLSGPPTQRGTSQGRYTVIQLPDGTSRRFLVCSA